MASMTPKNRANSAALTKSAIQTSTIKPLTSGADYLPRRIRAAGAAVMVVARKKTANHPTLLQKVAGAKTWLIYRVRRLTDGRSYVGVTSRTLATRTAVHDHTARLRPDVGGPGTLAEAIRQAYAQGRSFAEAFQVEILATASSPEMARRSERECIARFATARPNGFNIMPGGASLGGPANAEPVTIDHPKHGHLCYLSMMDAVADLNRERAGNGQSPLSLGGIYARRASGWSIDEALELKAHADGRRQRAAFRWDGRTYDSLHGLALATGMPIDTIRSQLYRARKAGCDTRHDAAQDRRLPGAHRTGGVGYGLRPPLALPHPRDAAAAPVDATTFARLTGLPKATVLHRYHRLVAQGGSAVLSRDGTLAALTQRFERRVLITLPLPNGQSLQGGVRKVIADLLATPALKWGRAEHLGSSAIRARLRRIPGWPEHLAPEHVAWAFGFKPAAWPGSDGPVATKATSSAS